MRPTKPEETSSLFFLNKLDAKVNINQLNKKLFLADKTV
jgi:hypothetical protein